MCRLDSQLNYIHLHAHVNGILKSCYSIFVRRLLDRVQSEDPTWKDSGTAFITSITRLLERLLDYRSVIQGDENRDKRMSCTVNLLVGETLQICIKNKNRDNNGSWFFSLEFLQE